jgi:signal transduction histidine kinase
MRRRPSFFVRSMSVNEAELAAILSRLATLENKFQEAVEAEKLEAMAEFAAGAGHEINNPLTIIAGRAQLFLHGETDPERRRSLALVNSQAMRIYEMIADMMLFARPPQPKFDLVDAAKIIDETIADLQTAAAGQETALSRSGHSGPLEIEADAVQLTVAIRALCQNSLETLGHGGHIEIDVQSNGEEVLIRVSDNGPGITPEQRRHIFDPFFSARQAGRGLGLGLSKSWRIVTNHGGRIEVESRPGQGATFVVVLPRTHGQK